MPMVKSLFIIKAIIIDLLLKLFLVANSIVDY